MDFTNLTDFLNHLHREIGIPNVDCAVYYRHEPVYRYFTGYQDRAAGVPLREDATYFMYSCSKVVTATAALQLFERGKFLLDDPLEEYMPQFKGIQLRTTDPESGEEICRAPEHKIRVRDLFTMTGGFDYNLKTEAILSLLEAKRAEGKDATTLEVIGKIAEGTLIFEPGDHWKYSVCHDILGGLVETISGKRFRDYVRESIFEPVGMVDSTYHPTPDQLDRMVTLYRYDKEEKYAKEQPQKNQHILSAEYDSGGAGIISTTADFIRFAETLCRKGLTPGGERIIGSATVDLMRRNMLSPSALRTFNWQQMRGYGYGLGVRTLVDPAVGGALSSLGEFGWGGAAGSYVMIDPDRQVAAVYTQHMLNNLEPYVHPRLRNIINSCID